MKQEIVVCPKCNSDQISANQKGFNNTAGAVGMLTGSAMQGLALGSLGSGQVKITCLKCGNSFEPGEGSIKTIEDDGSMKIVTQEKEKKDNTGAIVFLILLVVIIAVAVARLFQ